MRGEVRGRMRSVEATQHLDSAARALRAILARRDPQHSYAVEIIERDRDDAGRLTATVARKLELDAKGDHPHPFGDRDYAPAGAAHDHCLEEST